MTINLTSESEEKLHRVGNTMGGEEQRFQPCLDVNVHPWKRNVGIISLKNIACLRPLELIPDWFSRTRDADRDNTRKPAVALMLQLFPLLLLDALKQVGLPVNAKFLPVP